MYNDYDQPSNDDLISLRNACETMILLNTDKRPKELGDKVKLVDGSSLCDETGKKRYVVEPEIKNQIFMIIGIGDFPVPEDQFINMILGPDHIPYKNDITVIHPTLGKFYTNRDFVVLEDFVTVNISNQKGVK